MKTAFLEARRPAPRTLVIGVLAALASGAAGATAQAARPPITFERNDGQFPAPVIFAARGVAGEVAVHSGEVAISPRRRERDAATLRIRLAGANAAPEVEGVALAPTRSHYYRGSERIEAVPHYAEVRLKEVYPGIDLALHGSQGELEYDFIVAPGADPREIRLDLSKADATWIDARGNLVLRAGGETLVQQAPVAYQDIDGHRVAVAAGFALEETPGGEAQARFVLGAYDAARSLVIDPVLQYSSYFGGPNDDSGTVVAIDPSGIVHFAYDRYTSAGATYQGVAVEGFDPATNTIVYTATLSGSSTAFATRSTVRGLAIKPNAGGAGQHHAVIVGGTRAADFPHCTGTPECPDHQGGEDAFIAEIGPSGALVRSRLIGGTGDDGANGVTVDAANHLFVVGSTSAPNFPLTPNAYDAIRNGSSDAYLLRLDNGLNMAYSTLLGGSGAESARAVAVDAEGNVYIAGHTQSGDFPQVGFTSTPTGNNTAFITKLHHSGASLAYSRFSAIGSSGATTAAAVRLLEDGVVVAGISGSNDAFVLRLDGSGEVAHLATLGGSSFDGASALAVAPNGDIYVTGSTSSSNFPSVNPLPGQSTLNSASVAFVTRLRNDVVDFSTFLGPATGASGSSGHGIALDASGRAWVSGIALSNTFPVTFGAYRTSRLGASDAFLARIQVGSPRPVSMDVDGDGRSNIVYRHEGTGQVWRLSVDGTVAGNGGPLYTEPDTAWGIVAEADFDGDGTSDLVWRNTGTGQVYLMRMGPSGTPVGGGVIHTEPSAAWQIVATPDLDNDGRADLVWRNSGSGVVWAMRLDGQQVVSQGLLHSEPDTAWRIVATGDFSGTGRRNQLVWHHATDGRAYMMTVGASGSGFAASGQMFYSEPNTQWRILGAGDSNNDGRTDLYWRNATSGQVFLMQMNGPAIVAGQQVYAEPNLAWQVAALGDYDGDGKTDLLWRNELTGQLYLMKMDGFTITAQGIAYHEPNTAWTVVSPATNE